MIPEYSNAALEAKDLFYNRRIVYVEGCQDVIFWSECFELLGISCIVEPVGGVKEIHKYIQKILNEDIDLLVALDRDYSNYTHDSYDDKRILITPCHSIENLIFCFPMANKIIKRYTSQNKNFLDRIKKEAKKFEELFFDFLVYDILNIIHKRGIDVLDKSFMSYIDKNGLLDQERYNNKLKKIKEELHETELFEKIKIQIGDNFYKEIRGHFLESWMCSVVRYIIKNNGYTNNIDNTSLRTSFLECSCRQKCLLKKELLNSIVYKWSSFFNLKNVH